MKCAPALLLLSALFSLACATGGGADLALVEAGRRIRREQSPPTASDLRLEVDSFLDNELPLLRRSVDRQLERERKVWRAIFVGGTALGVLASTSGTLKDSNGAKVILNGVGVAAAIGGGVAYAIRTPELRACKAFLDGARQDVAFWRRNGIPPGEGTVTPAVWHAWIDRVAAIRGHESCRKVR
jgi:hypothetical protein